MNSLSKLTRWALAVFLAAALCLTPAMTFAQEPQAEQKEAKSYVLGYALTTLCIGLGIFVVVRPGKRKVPKIKRQDEDEDEKPKGGH